MKLWNSVGLFLLLLLVAVTVVCSDDESVVDTPIPPPKTCDHVTAGDLTTDPAFDGDPAWSPNCDEIAFTSQRSGDYEIHVKNLKTGAIRQVTTSGGDDPAWSPDEKKIAYDNKSHIYVVPKDGGAATAITTGSSPTWSPDGSKLAFMRLVGPAIRELWTINTDLSDSTLIVSLGGDEFFCCPDWSPDGTEIAVTRERAIGSTKNDIWAINVASKTWRMVSSGTRDAEDWHPDWSPDGTEIVFGGDNITVIPASGETGSNPAVQLTCVDTENNTPTWSPDGEWVAYLSEEDSDIKIIASDPCSTIVAPCNPIADEFCTDGYFFINGDSLLAGVRLIQTGCAFAGSSWVQWMPLDQGGTFIDRPVVGTVTPDSVLMDIQLESPNDPDNLRFRFLIVNSTTLAGFVKLFDPLETDEYPVTFKSSHACQWPPTPRPDSCNGHPISAGKIIDEFFWAGEPAWSPDCAEVAYTSQSSGSYQIHAYSLDGKTTRQITARGGGNIAWSPDGTMIAYDDSSKVYAMPAAGGAETYIASGYHPAWSPDGTQLAFIRLVGGTTRELWVIDADRSDSTLVATLVNEFMCCPDWSPDGTKIAVTRERAGVNPYNDIWTINVVSKTWHMISAGTEPVEDWHPRWSPDGTEIAISRNGNIFVLPATGETSGNPAVQITCIDPGLVGENDYPTWSSDGVWIAYEAEGSGDIIVVRREACSP